MTTTNMVPPLKWTAKQVFDVCPKIDVQNGETKEMFKAYLNRPTDGSVTYMDVYIFCAAPGVFMTHFTWDCDEIATALSKGEPMLF